MKIMGRLNAEEGKEYCKVYAGLFEVQGFMKSFAQREYAAGGRAD